MGIRAITRLAIAAGLLAVVFASGPAAAEELAYDDDGWVETVEPGEGTAAGELAEIRLRLRNEQ